MANKILNCGIYKIENILNGDCYIGQSKHLNKREKQHFKELLENKHDNRYLQNSYNKHGCENFIFKVVIYCELNELSYYEQSLVDLFSPAYNIRKECVDSNKGTKWTDGARKHMSETRSGENHPMFGRHHTEETKKILSEKSSIMNGENHPMWGHPRTEETKKKLSEANRGKVMPEETKKKISEKLLREDNPLRGKPLTKETKHKLWLIRITDKETVMKIKNLLNDNVSVKDICKEVGVCTKTVYRVKNGYYKDVYGI